jgi:small-conductance mechanosensitive channel
VLGIALGFAVRDTVDNYISSLMLSLRQPFAASDHVRIGDVGEGRVIRLTPRATVLMTLDGNQLRIPNATVFKSVILNFSRNPERRFQFDLGVDPADELETARALAESTVAGLPFVLAEPKAFAVLADMADSTAIVRVHGWIDQQETDFLRARSRALLATVKAFEDGGVALPDPGMRVTLNQSEQTAALPARTKAQAHPRDNAVDVGDVVADDDIVRLVHQERALDGDDLLDPARRQD